MRTAVAFSLLILSNLTLGCTIQQAKTDASGGAAGALGQAGNAPSEGGAGGSDAGAGGSDAGADSGAGSGGSDAGAGGSEAGGASSAGAGGDAGASGNAGSSGTTGGSAGQGGSEATAGAGQGGSTSGAGGGEVSGGSGGGGGEAGGTAGSGGSPGGGITSCSTATYFSGNPWNKDEPTGQNPQGHPSKGSPPLRFHDIAFNGDILGVANQSELWVMDTTVTDPVYIRVTGKDDKNGYKPGPCSDALLSHADGLAPLPGGDWLLADFVGNALLRVSGAGTPGCQVEVLAGNAKPYDGVQTVPLNPGDQDGPGAQAKLNGPQNVVTDSEGNAYFFDRSNRKVKRMANDAAHTVSTMADLSGPEYSNAYFNALALLGGDVYLGGSRSIGHDLVVKVSSAGQISNILDDSDLLDGITGSLANINAAVSDGEAILLLGNAGRIWRLSPDGTPSSYIAGGGKQIGLNPDNYDFTKPFPAKEAPMFSQSTTTDTMAIRGKNLYVASVANGVGFWLYEFSCQ